MRKIAFFDIDGTLTSEIDGSIPQSCIEGIRLARKNGHLMFINTGRCLQNVEKRFRDIGFDGYICGCGTNIVINDLDILYIHQSHETIMEILSIARTLDVDILFESRQAVSFDLSRGLHHPAARRQLQHFYNRGYEMYQEYENPDFVCDKFVIWYETEDQLKAFRQISDSKFECIDRGGTFREFVPYGFSKATGIQAVLDYYSIPSDNAYCFGDSNNDLPMLLYLKNSIAMGNSEPVSLYDRVSYVTDKASENGIYNALKHFEFF